MYHISLLSYLPISELTAQLALLVFVNIKMKCKSILEQPFASFEKAPNFALDLTVLRTEAGLINF